MYNHSLLSLSLPLFVVATMAHANSSDGEESPQGATVQRAPFSHSSSDTPATRVVVITSSSTQKEKEGGASSDLKDGEADGSSVRGRLPASVEILDSDAEPDEEDLSALVLPGKMRTEANVRAFHELFDQLKDYQQTQFVKHFLAIPEAIRGHILKKMSNNLHRDRDIINLIPKVLKDFPEGTLSKSLVDNFITVCQGQEKSNLVFYTEGEVPSLKFEQIFSKAAKETKAGRLDKAWYTIRAIWEKPVP